MDDGASLVLRVAGVRVPADRYVGEINGTRLRGGGLYIVGVLHGHFAPLAVGQFRLRGGIHTFPRRVAPVVDCHGVRAKIYVAAQVELKVHVREPRLLHLRAKIGDALLRNRLAVPLHKRIDVVDHHNGATFYLVVVRAREILLDPAGDNGTPVLVRYLRAPYKIALPLDANLVVPSVSDSVVGVHDVELHALAVLRAKEALVESVLKERTTAVPVPVVDEHIDAGGCRGIYLAGDDDGVCLVFVAP